MAVLTSLVFQFAFVNIKMTVTACLMFERFKFQNFARPGTFTLCTGRVALITLDLCVLASEFVLGIAVMIKRDLVPAGIGMTAQAVTGKGFLMDILMTGQTLCIESKKGLFFFMTLIACVNRMFALKRITGLRMIKSFLINLHHVIVLTLMLNVTLNAFAINGCMKSFSAFYALNQFFMTR